MLTPIKEDFLLVGIYVIGAVLLVSLMLTDFSNDEGGYLSFWFGISATVLLSVAAVAVWKIRQQKD